MNKFKKRPRSITKHTKYKVDIHYDHYKFFVVETEVNIRTLVLDNIF